jgi:hypothetical protein
LSSVPPAVFSICSSIFWVWASFEERTVTCVSISPSALRSSFAEFTSA